MFHKHNVHIWVLAGPYEIRPRVALQRYIVNVRTNIVGDRLIGSYVLLIRLAHSQISRFYSEGSSGYTKPCPSICSERDGVLK